MSSGAYNHKPHSEETKAKISKSNKGKNKGRHFSPNTEFKKGQGGFHKKHTLISRKKMSIARSGNPSKLKGRKRPEFSGENHPRWKGENCKKQDERNDSAYLNWMTRVKKRDKWICKMKNSDCVGYCIVHHILPWRDYPNERYNINNGITLCQFHHPRKRVDEQRLIPFFQSMVEVI